MRHLAKYIRPKEKQGFSWEGSVGGGVVVWFIIALYLSWLFSSVGFHNVLFSLLGWGSSFLFLWRGYCKTWNWFQMIKYLVQWNLDDNTLTYLNWAMRTMQKNNHTHIFVYNLLDHKTPEVFIQVSCGLGFVSSGYRT